jgi:carbamate kinase
MSRTALIAIGGNSLIRAGEKGTIDEQVANTRRTARAVVGLIDDGFSLVLTHGNGPQVGAALLRSERASDQVYSQSLDVCDATTQGEIGYLLQQSLHNELRAAGLRVPVATILSQVVVSADDPAMEHPTKPIGPFYSRADAEGRARLLGWQVVEDAARGYRRVVPSPEPIEIVEEPVIRTLLAQGVLVIAAGGGGIPVVRTAPRRSWPADSASIVSSSRPTRIACTWTIAGRRNGRLAVSRLRTWRPTTRPGSSRPATWVRKSNRRCGS